MIHCSKCGTFYGGTGGWMMALIQGWIWKKIEGEEITLCPKCSQGEK